MRVSPRTMRMTLPAKHFAEGNQRSKDQSHNAQEGDAKINALHAVDLVSFLITPPSRDGSGRIENRRQIRRNVRG
jgi:hypothetical protein